jgi:arsenate reductase (thioredoxin)
MKNVLFVCIHNSGRSQMAEAFLNRLGAGVAKAESAGTEPAEGLNQIVLEAMREIGYDMAGHFPKVMTSEMVNRADKIITMGCDVDAGVCPASFVATEDWGLDDPKGKPLEDVRRIRDQILAKVEAILKNLTTLCE